MLLLIFNLYVQTTFHDDGHILFPSLTFCKFYMYTERDFMKTFKNLPMATNRKLFSEKSWSRDMLFESVYHKTMDGTLKNPCITVAGLREGAPCSFPFLYPDCSEGFKPVKNVCSYKMFIEKSLSDNMLYVQLKRSSWILQNQVIKTRQ